MVDPTAVVLGAFAGRAASRAVTAILGPEPSADSTPELSSEALVALPGSSGDDTAAILTQEQLNDIEKFLDTSEVASLVQSWCILNIAAPDRPDTSDALDEIELTFQRIAEQWNSIKSRGQNWDSVSIDIWRLIEATLRDTINVSRRSSMAIVERAEVFKSVSRAEILRGDRRPLPAFLRRLVDTLSTPDRIAKTGTAVHDIITEAKSRFGELQLNHVQEDYRFELDQLYVSRTLVSRDTGEEHNSDDVLGGSLGLSRTVVVGDPGVGKSTLVRHLVYSVATRGSDRAPLLIQCKDYASTSWKARLTQFVANIVSLSLNQEFEEQAIVDILAIGAAYVIFDGLDEIIDIQRRREFTRRIESFVESYPLTPVLVTTRKVGYSRAKLRDNMFHIFDLNEFSPNQVEEYVARWFDLTGRSNAEKVAFLRESEAVEDIRANPLMLSLLCTLYRARGYIPRNRRQIYRDCSDLLFTRWDAMRHVEQPYDHRQYGERLMQELARFFYNSQAAQSGVEEGQLLRLISQFFRDTASVDASESENRARQFLDFCADRAWLLSAKGSNERGIRLFGFTHRTFMEYMAAEALSRNAATIEDAVEEVIKVFSSDPSSVLPDVLVQCIDDKFERGAELVLKSLLDRGRKVSSYGDKYLSLCLRIVNSSPMSRAISDPLPVEIWSYWRRIGPVKDSYGSSLALFELYRDPRRRILRSLEEAPKIPLRNDWENFTPSSFRRDVCVRWAHFEALDMTKLFEDEWSTELAPHIKIVRDRVITLSERHPHVNDSVLIDVLISGGLISSKQFDAKRLLIPKFVVDPFDHVSAGSILRALSAALHEPESLKQHQQDILQWVLDNIVGKKRLSLTDGHDLTSALAGEVRYWRSISSQELSEISTGVPQIADLLLWLAFVVAEVTAPSLHVFHDSVDGVVGMSTFIDLVATRERRLGVDERVSGNPMKKSQVASILGGFGPWAISWTNGKYFVG